MTEINNNVKCRLKNIQINYVKKSMKLFLFLIKKRIMVENQHFFDKIVDIGKYPDYRLYRYCLLVKFQAVPIFFILYTNVILNI